MKRKLAVVMMVFCLASLFLAGSLEAAVYKFTDLMQPFPNDPGNQVTAINGPNQIVGNYDTPLPQFNGGYFYDLEKGNFTMLQPLGGDYTNSYAYGINNLGQIVGGCSNSQNTVFAACVWTDPAQAPTQLSPLPNYTSCCAYGINDNGLIVGKSYNYDDGSQHACKWNITAPGQPVDLGTLEGPPAATSEANGVNNAGQIVGWAYNAQGKQRACLWNAGQTTAQDLAISLPDGAAARFINSQGNVLGNAMYGLGYGNAFYWDHQTGLVQVVSDNYDSYPIGLSDANLVLAGGETIMGGLPIFIWTPSGGTQDLNQMIVNLPSGVTVTHVNLISPKGNILGWYDKPNDMSSFLLTPIVAQPGITLLLLD